MNVLEKNAEIKKEDKKPHLYNKKSYKQALKKYDGIPQVDNIEDTGPFQKKDPIQPKLNPQLSPSGKAETKRFDPELDDLTIEMSE